jgi:hypothetical protein
VSATTPHYGWPYQTLTDPPDGAGLGEDLALAIEATVQGLDTQLNTQIDIQTFTANGTWTKPTDAKSVWVRMVGGGGAGGGAVTGAAGANAEGSGGGAGEYGEGWFDASTLAATVAVTIGAGGTGVSAGTGNSGGTTSFGAGFTALGGSGGAARATSTSTFFAGGGTNGGTGGVGGTLHVPGGGGGMCMGGGALGVSGKGGDSLFGAGGTSIRTQSQPATIAGNTAVGFGAGGGGAITAGTGASVAGGAGTGGYCIVVTFF